MKKALTLIWNLLLILSLFNANAEDTGAPFPYPVYGIMYLDGDVANGMQVNLENTNTGEIVTRYTSGGEFVLDLSEFTQGWDSGTTFRFTYCISDSRCREASETFTPTGDHKDLGRNVPLEPSGLSAPFIVSGKIYKDGVLQSNVEITIEDLDQEYSKTMKTNEAGEYIWNLANWGRYDTGDTIRVTWDGTSVIGYVTNIGHLSLDINKVTPEYVPPSEERRGGGGSGQDQQRGTPSTPTEPREEPTEPTEPKEEEKPELPLPEPVKVNWLWITLGIAVAVVAVGYYVFKKK